MMTCLHDHSKLEGIQIKQSTPFSQGWQKNTSSTPVYCLKYRICVNVLVYVPPPETKTRDGFYLHFYPHPHPLYTPPSSVL